ncbi:hypothetical protein [Azohydromonas lata]|uniref:hypothetical protein n=1 Tax=Azohydromonas lata TaxID=45677 RepID=UPI0008335389|nr:hypothetical protein [Azohydromonas lata]
MSLTTRSFAALPNPGAADGFELRFNCLFTGRGLSFPCDASGAVDLAALSQRARDNFDRALSGVGRDFSVPQVVPAY